MARLRSVLPARPIGTSEPKLCTFLPGNVDGISGVQIGPGATPLTRIPFFTTAWASERVNVTIAPFVAE